MYTKNTTVILLIIENKKERLKTSLFYFEIKEMIRRIVVVFLVYILGIFILSRLRNNVFYMLFLSICFFIYMIWELFNYYNGNWKILFTNLPEYIDIAQLKKSHQDLSFFGWRVNLLVMKVSILMMIIYISLLKIERQ